MHPPRCRPRRPTGPIAGGGTMRPEPSGRSGPAPHRVLFGAAARGAGALRLGCIVAHPMRKRRFGEEALMPRKIVDLSARSRIIRQEPFGLHFWECDPREFLDYLRDPRAFLQAMGIDLPLDCRVETTIENHDWLSAH